MFTVFVKFSRKFLKHLLFKKKNIPKKYRSKDNYWFGFSVRARPIIYSNSRVDQRDLSTYEDLSNNKWKSRICMRSSNNVYNQSLIASLIINLGIKRTEEWMEGLVKNFARRPYGGDRDQIRAVASGECDISIINTYYLANMLNSKNKSDKKAAEKVSIFWPNQETNGTHVNISGAGIVKGSKNLYNAIKFLDTKDIAKNILCFLLQLLENLVIKSWFQYQRLRDHASIFLSSKPVY